jgi:AcrR family transcriptional regulator
MAAVSPQPLTRKERARATRRRIVRSAHRLFVENGYEPTTMASIAQAAGVAVQTVYFVFHTKAELLQEVCRTAVLGEDQIPPEEQAWYRDLGREADGAALLRRFVENIAPIAGRTAPISAVIREVRDPDALAVYHESERRRRDAYRGVIRLFARDGRLRPDLDEERATEILMFLAGPQSFLVLVHEYGWPVSSWLAWTVGVLADQLL